MDIAERISNRMNGEEIDYTKMNELITIVSDRLCIRLGETQLPDAFRSICADASVKMYRRLYYEGITTEGTEGISTSFVSDVLSEYNDEISSWKEQKSNTSGSGRVVRFL